MTPTDRNGSPEPRSGELGSLEWPLLGKVRRARPPVACGPASPGHTTPNTRTTSALRGEVDVSKRSTSPSGFFPWHGGSAGAVGAYPAGAGDSRFGIGHANPKRPAAASVREHAQTATPPAARRRGRAPWPTPIRPRASNVVRALPCCLTAKGSGVTSLVLGTRIAEMVRLLFFTCDGLVSGWFPVFEPHGSRRAGFGYGKDKDTQIDYTNIYILIT